MKVYIAISKNNRINGVFTTIEGAKLIFVNNCWSETPQLSGYEAWVNADGCMIKGYELEGYELEGYELEGYKPEVEAEPEAIGLEAMVKEAVEKAIKVEQQRLWEKLQGLGSF